MERPQISPREIAAAQAASNIFAHDRGQEQHTLSRLQRLYAAKLAQVEAFHSFFDVSQPDIVLHSASQELAMSLTACPQTNEIYSGLRDGLADELHRLEEPIVAAQLNIERDERNTEQYNGELTHMAGFHALCKPTVPTMSVLTPSRATESLASKAA